MGGSDGKLAEEVIMEKRDIEYKILENDRLRVKYNPDECLDWRVDCTKKIVKQSDDDMIAERRDPNDFFKKLNNGIANVYLNESFISQCDTVFPFSTDITIKSYDGPNLITGMKKDMRELLMAHTAQASLVSDHQSLINSPAYEMFFLCHKSPFYGKYFGFKYTLGTAHHYLTLPMLFDTDNDPISIIDAYYYNFKTTPMKIDISISKHDGFPESIVNSHDDFNWGLLGINDIYDYGMNEFVSKWGIPITVNSGN